MTAVGKPQVEILLASKATAAKLAKGAKVKIKAEIVPLGTTGTTVKLQRGELYTGDQPAVQAAQLTKDFAANKTAALEKYRRKEAPELEVIVERVVPDRRLAPFGAAGKCFARLGDHTRRILIERATLDRQ